MGRYGDYMKLFRDISNEGMVLGYDGNTVGWNNVSTDVAKWIDIEKEAQTNPTLRDALDKCLVLYNLSKEHKNV